MLVIVVVAVFDTVLSATTPALIGALHKAILIWMSRLRVDNNLPLRNSLMQIPKIYWPSVLGVAIRTPFINWMGVEEGKGFKAVVIELA